jgi:hypothetical protein
MLNRTSAIGSELFILDNNDIDRKVVSCVYDWHHISKAINCSSGNFEVVRWWPWIASGSTLTSFACWGTRGDTSDEKRVPSSLDQTKRHLDSSTEAEKKGNEFPKGVPDIAEGTVGAK